MNDKYLNEIKWGQNKILPIIAQEFKTKKILMLAWINILALQKTLSTGYVHYWSRSRKCIWKKGESSGNLQILKELRIDCDNDSFLAIVNQVSNIACHTGRNSCFYKQITKGKIEIIEPVLKDPDEIYKKK